MSTIESTRRKENEIQEGQREGPEEGQYKNESKRLQTSHRQWCHYQQVRPISVRLPAAHGAKTTAMHLREVNPVFARDMMSRLIDFLRYDLRAKKWKPMVAPLAIAATMIERKAEWKFRNIVGVISTPTMRPDGSLLIVEGHDATTDLLLVDPPDMPPIPDKPTRADAVAALNRLKDLFAEFPYVNSVSSSVALSGVISAVARGAFLNAPMHACSATVAGSGKSYQNDVIAMIAIGDKMPVMSTGPNGEKAEQIGIGHDRGSVPHFAQSSALP